MGEQRYPAPYLGRERHTDRLSSLANLRPTKMITQDEAQRIAVGGKKLCRCAMTGRAPNVAVYPGHLAVRPGATLRRPIPSNLLDLRLPSRVDRAGGSG
jgi:hypothetical protein